MPLIELKAFTIKILVRYSNTSYITILGMGNMIILILQVVLSKVS